MTDLLTFYAVNWLHISAVNFLVLQCFDAVGLVAGKHPACRNWDGGGMLAWLSVWGEVQICIWPS